MKKHTIFAAILLFVLAGALYHFSPAGARPADGLPPRPTVEPTQSAVEITGGAIQLRAAAERAGLWSKVQWLDADRQWHDVDGWQGEINGEGKVTWAVFPDDFGKGPFRWIVTSGDAVVFASEPFDLPAAEHEVVVVAWAEKTAPAVASAPTATPAPTGLSAGAVSMSPPFQAPGANGYIILQRHATQPLVHELWTSVEWQDPAGAWHKVDGWQGTFDAQSRVVWWVSPAHGGTGPFRWVVYEADTWRILSTSAAFTLPTQHQNLQIDLLLP